ncbi:MAG TPA: hypothetical protein VK955_17980, partial [Xanthobacteraceae bacterium]|nr:hypothetical protein [Xanthobacteraceae bacterium]
MDRAISRIDARNGRAGHRGLDASGGIIMPLTEITSDERGNAAAQPTVFVRLDIVGGGDLFRHFLFVVFDSAVRWLRRSVLPNDLNE